jgi:hypothetical protein
MITKIIPIKNAMKKLVCLVVIISCVILFAFCGVSRFLPIATSVPIQEFIKSPPLVFGNLAFRQEFSISLWLMPTEGNEEWAAILDYKHNGTKSFAFHQKGGENNLYAFGVHSKNGVHGVYANLILRRWQHVVIVKSLSEMSIYVDGQKVDSKYLDRDFEVGYAGDEILTVGAWGYGNRFWHGSVSCVRVFDYPLPVSIIEFLKFNDNGCVN